MGTWRRWPLVVLLLLATLTLAAPNAHAGHAPLKSLLLTVHDLPLGWVLEEAPAPDSPFPAFAYTHPLPQSSLSETFFHRPGGTSQYVDGISLRVHRFTLLHDALASMPQITLTPATTWALSGVGEQRIAGYVSTGENARYWTYFRRGPVIEYLEVDAAPPSAAITLATPLSRILDARLRQVGTPPLTTPNKPPLDSWVVVGPVRGLYRELMVYVHSGLPWCDASLATAAGISMGEDSGVVSAMADGSIVIHGDYLFRAGLPDGRYWLKLSCSAPDTATGGPYHTFAWLVPFVVPPPVVKPPAGPPVTIAITPTPITYGHPAIIRVRSVPGALCTLFIQAGEGDFTEPAIRINHSGVALWRWEPAWYGTVQATCDLHDAYTHQTLAIR